MDSNGKVVVITGASMGIGEALASEFLLHGATVVLSSRDQARVEAARQRVLAAASAKSAEQKTAAITCDVRSRAAIEQLAAEIQHRYGSIDVWVNNAGFGVLDSIERVDIAAAKDMFATNLVAPIEAMQVVAPIMRAQHSGTIVNISSVAGHIAVPYMGTYCASKHALNAISKAARLELKGSGVNVLNVCPGFIRTNFGVNAVKGSDRMRIDENLRRGITAERLARAIVRGVAKRKREIVVPWNNWLFVKLYQFAPQFVEWTMSKAVKPATGDWAKEAKAR